MKRELEFAWTFATSLLLLAGAFAVAHSATTAKAKNANGITFTEAAATSTNQAASTPQTTQAAAVMGRVTAQPVATQPQPSATTTKPKTMVSADKRTIPLPQL